MRQSLLNQLLAAFNQLCHNRYDLVQLINDMDHRNQVLDEQLSAGPIEQLHLIMQIRLVEDQLHHESQADLLVEEVTPVITGLQAD